MNEKYEKNNGGCDAVWIGIFFIYATRTDASCRSHRATRTGKAIMIRDTQAQDTLVESTSRPFKKWIVAAALCGAVAVSANAFISRPSAEHSVQLESVKIAEVVHGELIRDVVSNGRIVAANAPQVYSPEQGFVELLVQAGDQVKVGQAVAKVESPELQNQLKQELSELARLKGELARKQLDVRRQTLQLTKQADLAEVDLAAAQRESRRAKKSIVDHLISQIDLEKAVDDLARAELNFKHAKKEVALAKDTLAFELKASEETVSRQQLVVDDLQRQVKALTINASVNGVVGNVLVQPKALVVKNDALMTLVDLTAYEAELNVPESYADQLGLGMAVEVSLGGKMLEGTLSAISPEVTNREVTARVRFLRDNLEGIRQNQQLSARILLENKPNVLKVRRGSFMQSGGHVAYRVEGELATKTTIQIGSTSMREVEILSGLQAGDRIIISNYETLEKAPTVLLR